MTWIGKNRATGAAPGLEGLLPGLSFWLRDVADSPVHGPKLLYQARLPWPGHSKPQWVSLVSCQFTGPEGSHEPLVALAAPSVYGFLGLDYEGFEIEDLLAMYAGWDICFQVVRNPYYPGRKQGADSGTALKAAELAGLARPEITENLVLYNTNYYVLKGLRNGLPTLAIGPADGLEVLPATAIHLQRPLYWWLGKQFWIHSGGVN